jgi:hypothetical protein
MTREAIKQWKKLNKEKHNGYNKESYANNKDKYKEKRADYYQANKEIINDKRKKRLIEKRKNNPHQRRERKTKFASPQEKKEYENKLRRELYKLNPDKHIQRVHNRRRKMGFNKLNNRFNESVWHHINNDDVVAIPKSIHEKFSSNSTGKHRELIMNYYCSLENMLKNLTPLTQGVGK